MNTMPNIVSFFEPCELYVPRDLLKHVLTLNLVAAETELARVPVDDPERAALEFVVAQRRQLLRWLDTQDVSVFMAMYPTSEEELHEKP